MASGFDTTAFSTGLLQGFNNQQAHAQHDVEEGNTVEYKEFEQAKKEYDDAKAKQTDQSAKVDALANIISGGKPNAAAYSTARDAVEMGYTGQEHLPYVMDAYKATKADMDADPEKWTGVKQPSNDPYKQDVSNLVNSSGYIKDSNPNQTNVLRKFGDQTSVDQLEKVRNHQLDRPYQNLPGANWGDAQTTANNSAASHETAVGNAKLAVENSPAAAEAAKNKAKAGVSGQMSAYGYSMDENGQPVANNSGPTPQDINKGAQQPAPNMANQQQTNAMPQGADALQVPAAQLQPPGAPQQLGQAQPPTQPPASNAGIQLSGPPPGQQPAATQPNAQPTQPQQPQQQPPQGMGTPQPQAQPQPQVPTSQNPQAMPTMAKTQLGTAIDFKALETQGNFNAAALDKLTPSDAAYVRGVVAGQRQPIPPYAGARNAHTQMLLEAIQSYDPSYTDGRFAARNTFLHGQEATNLRYLNTAYNHMGLLNEAAEQLNNTNLPALNKIALALGIQEGKSAPVVYDNIRHYVSSEMNKFYSNGHGGLAQLEMVANSIDKAQSPEQMRGVMKNNIELLDGAADSYDAQYQHIMGNAYTPKGFLSGTAQATRDSLTASTAQTGSTNNAAQQVHPQTQDVLSKFGLQ